MRTFSLVRPSTRQRAFAERQASTLDRSGHPFTSASDREINAFVEFCERNLNTDFGHPEHSIRGEEMAYPVIADPFEHSASHFVLGEDDVPAHGRRGGVFMVPDVMTRPKCPDLGMRSTSTFGLTEC